MTFRALVTGFNAALYARQCIESILNQTVPCEVLAIDDGSKDDTYEILKEYPINTARLSENNGAAYARYQGLEFGGFDPDDIIVLVDMDDYLPHERVLERVKREYDNGADCTFGSYTFEGGGSWPQGPYPEECDYRTHEWRCSPLRTFKYSLFDPDPERYIMDGEWIRKATDVALMIPILEKSVKPVFIPDCLYVYRNQLSTAARRVTPKDYQARVLEWLKVA